MDLLWLAQELEKRGRGSRRDLARVLGLAHLVQRFAEVAHDVELVEQDGGFRRLVPRHVTERLPHVHDGELDFAALFVFSLVLLKAKHYLRIGRFCPFFCQQNTQPHPLSTPPIRSAAASYSQAAAHAQLGPESRVPVPRAPPGQSLSRSS